MDRTDNEVIFTINDKLYRVDACVPIDTTLNTYIRNNANLRGTKNMCHEGGCGACVVAATITHTVTKKGVTMAVNSCLVPVFSCHGWAITTVEGIGSKKMGYHKLQTRLAQLNGTQCGYCTPGMIMNMFSLTADKSVTMAEVENSFGGNICRCTGYRPILDAFKSMAVDATPELLLKIQDIEDLNCPRTGKPCQGKCVPSPTGASDISTFDDFFGERTTCQQRQLNEDGSVHLSLQGANWYRATSMGQIFDILKSVPPNEPYMLVGGNTGQGVFRRQTEPKLFIDLSGVEELKRYTTDPQLTLGSGMSLTDTMQLFYTVSEVKHGYQYLYELADHIDLIANVPVRNGGTLAGNIAMKHQYNEFPSDLFLIFETVGAKITIVSETLSSIEMSMLAFLATDMHRRVIHSFRLPKLDSSSFVKTYKITPRAQNAHAFVNAGFFFKLNKDNVGEILEKPSIVYGGINPKFVHATKTEEFLEGKQLFDFHVLQAALGVLDKELVPDVVLTDPSPAYRKGLAKALFYKFVLSLAPAGLEQKFVSGGFCLVRPLSSGKQEYETNKSIWPLNQPIPKVEALVQCSGEAKYVNDVPTIPGELFAAFVLTRVAQGNITKIDPSPALNMPGVISFLGKESIPGKNSFTARLFNMPHDEELFSSGKILYAGQPVGIVVAESQTMALKAASAVLLEYSNTKKPLLTIRQVLASGDKSRVIEEVHKEPTDPGARKKATRVIKGSWDIPDQYHYSMETQSCVCIPIEDGLDVFPASQWMDLVQVAISNALVIPENSINVNVRRLGGAYGCKISRSSQVAVACALAAHTLQKPVRFVLSLEATMESMGKRFPCLVDYEVGVDNKGKIQYMEATLYQNSGSNLNESVLVFFTAEHFSNCYDKSTWDVYGKSVLTDNTSHTYCRAPGSMEGTAFIEYIMEHIAREMKMDPFQVRLVNMNPENTTMPKLMNEVKTWSDFEKRKEDIEKFNKNNRWKKRGIALVPMNFPLLHLGGYSAIVSIYSVDATVAVSHGGIEMGQGINTKVAQVVAHILGIELKLVLVKPSNSLVAPNNMVTGGSITSESCCYAAMACCDILNKRLQPIRAKLSKPTWKQVIAEASKESTDLCATYRFTGKEIAPTYDIFGVTVTEVEVDILTGQTMVQRVDLLEDAGESLSPEVDVGQVEGAFVMGLGYWLMESLIYHPDTGELLTNRTWNYKPPGAKDIPADFRVMLRRKSPNPLGVLRSKATGEPPLTMACSVHFAVRQALNSARADAGNSDSWYTIGVPASAENVFLSSLTTHDQFLL